MFRKFEFKNLTINPAFIDGEMDPEDSSVDTDERKSFYESLDENESPEFSMFEMISEIQNTASGTGSIFVKALPASFYRNGDPLETELASSPDKKKLDKTPGMMFQMTNRWILYELTIQNILVEKKNRSVVIFRQLNRLVNLSANLAYKYLIKDEILFPKFQLKAVNFIANTTQKLETYFS